MINIFDYTSLMKSLNFQFTDQNLLKSALTHKSVTSDINVNNEKLEFIGDRVLGLLVCDLINDLNANLDLKDLATGYNALVNKQICAKACKHLTIDKYIIYDLGIFKDNQEIPYSVMGDALEAVLGGAYIEKKLQGAKMIFDRFWPSYIASNNIFSQDAKSRLQEWLQAKSFPLPVYKVIKQTGEDHNPEFIIELLINGYKNIQAKGKSKQEAQQKVAQIFLDENATDDK